MRELKTKDNNTNGERPIIPQLLGFLSDQAERKWIKDAACRGMDTNVFFPSKHESQITRKAKSICSKCPVIEECKEYGKDELYGIWGGQGMGQRKQAKKELNEQIRKNESGRTVAASSGNNNN